jgi:hypothetical protein
MMRLREAAREQLVFSFRKILKPMIRILLRAGIPYLEFREVVKGAYVEAAVRDGIRGHTGPLTRAILADHTGVPIADINRFIDDPSMLAPPESTNHAIITEVLHIWCTDSHYIGPYGLPLELDLEETPGRNLTTLVFKADPAANPKSILRDMVEYKIVKPVGARHYRAVARMNISNDIMSPQALEYFGRTMTNLANTLANNLGASGTAPRLQRSVVADGGLPEYALPEFEALIREKVQKLLLDVDDWLSANRPLWVEPARTIQTGLTTFHYITEPYDSTPLSTFEPPDVRPLRFATWVEPALGGKRNISD